MNLSIIIPVFNEEKTITFVLERLTAITLPKNVKMEIVIVDDGSTDKTVGIIKNIAKGNKTIKAIFHKKNLGKGAAVRSGIEAASGEYILIQDADLEYNPDYIPKLLAPVLHKTAEVVYGTRLKRFPNFKRDERSVRFFSHYIGNKTLSLITSVLYGEWITDMETGYKLFPKKVISGFSLQSKGFDFEPEITAKLLKNGYKIVELPIATNPRGYSEGKKINTVKDGTKALFTLIKYRFID